MSTAQRNDPLASSFLSFGLLRKEMPHLSDASTQRQMQ